MVEVLEVLLQWPVDARFETAFRRTLSDASLVTKMYEGSQQTSLPAGKLESGLNGTTNNIVETGAGTRGTKGPSRMWKACLARVRTTARVTRLFRDSNSAPYICVKSVSAQERHVSKASE